jgi:hypothetical protein
MAKRKKTTKKDNQRRDTEKEILAGREQTRAKQEKQLRIILIWMAALIIFLVVFAIFYQNASTFMYNGMKFKKVNMEGLRLYQTTFTFTKQEGTFKFDLYLRNNPKDLDKIPVNISNLMIRRGGFVSFDPRVSGCYGSNIAAHSIGNFFGALGMQIKGATTDKNLSEEQIIDWKTCEDAKNVTVIVVQKADATSIEKQGDCYILNIGNCEIIPVAERFILETSVQLLNKNK